MRIKQRELVGKKPAFEIIEPDRILQVYKDPMCVNVIDRIANQCYLINKETYRRYRLRWFLSLFSFR
jgi:hypothetical protein